MTHAKQKILIPYESMARLKDPTPSTSYTQMGALDTEMNTILQTEYAHDSEKWKRYNEVLQRYLYFTSEARKPIPIEIKSVPTTMDDSKQTSALRHQLSSVVPPTYKAQALKIHDYLSTGSPITWDTTGVVSIHGNPIPQSNIIDLISDMTRFRKNFEPYGVSQFIQALAKINIPSDLVGNEKRRTAILQAKQTGGNVFPNKHGTQNTQRKTLTHKIRPKTKHVYHIRQIPSRKSNVARPGWKKW